MWKLQLGAGYPRGSSPLYLYRRPWRHPTIAAEGDPPIYVTVPGQCRWLTEPQGAAGFRYFFELIFDSEDVEEFAGEWNLLDWNESAYPSGEPVRYSRLWEPGNARRSRHPRIRRPRKIPLSGQQPVPLFYRPRKRPPDPQHHHPLVRYPMTFATKHAGRYRPQPGEIEPQQFYERLAVCQNCQHRRANRCAVSREIVTLNAPQPRRPLPAPRMARRHTTAAARTNQPRRPGDVV